jgi:hypothetical protein
MESSVVDIQLVLKVDYDNNEDDNDAHNNNNNNNDVHNDHNNCDWCG